MSVTWNPFNKHLTVQAQLLICWDLKASPNFEPFVTSPLPTMSFEMAVIRKTQFKGLSDGDINSIDQN